MSKILLFLAAALTLAVCAATVPAEEPAVGAGGDQAAEATLQVLVDAIRSNNKAMVAVNLGLTDDEAAKFWPLYERYQKEISANGDRRVALIQDYIQNFGDLSDEKARKLLDDYLAIEADRVAVRRKYVPEFAAILPGRKVARFYQIENKMDAVLRYDLAATIPVLEE